MPGPLITLTTDFGFGSTYVAQLKGVLLSRIPTARIIDVSHDLAAHDIATAELHLRSTAFAFPIGTTHLIVVDPGVGTARRPIAVASCGMTFVGPDNGLLGVALAQTGARCVQIDQPGLFRQPVSPTFHGRDIFAPVAAELAAGLTLDDVGTEISDPVVSTLPAPQVEADRVVGESLGADRFGNLMTNLSVAVIAAQLGQFATRVAGDSVARCETYADTAPGDLMVLEGSDGYLEVAVREGSAAERLGRERGIPVECIR